ncbi:PREDICTED: uncharacterized protein LOC109243115 [Nicotiana attenuata]|uniref:uncharacterized protein LOC109243115 n=1 Tax=Nicotiana attenuata TaxID=49451 RepID=UPI000904E008|nr:PREDICTED: uncharacterized protein LOC109243115 [Nicotiana attenuata]
MKLTVIALPNSGALKLDAWNQLASEEGLAKKFGISNRLFDLAAFRNFYQEGHSSKNKKAKNCIAAGSLVSLLNQMVSLLKTKRIVQATRTNDKHQLNSIEKQLPQLGARVQEQLLQLPLPSASPPAQIVHEQVQQKSLNSTSLAPQALREQLQQKSLDSTTRPSAEKRKIGKTLMPSVHGRKERKLIVVNENNQPIGPSDNDLAELGSFLGTLARNAAFCPLNVFNWRKLQTKEDMWKYIKGKYDIPDASKNWVFESIQNAWRKYKIQLFNDHYKPYENDELRMEKRPVDVPESQFRDLLNYWNSDAYKVKLSTIP